MTLWKFRFALEYCKKARCISKENSKRMILNAYESSKLHILIRKHWKRFEIKNNFEKHLDNATKIVKSWPLWKQKVLG